MSGPGEGTFDGRSGSVPKVWAIVLAAGRSRRMGSQKLLLPIEGRPLIRRVVEALQTPAVARVLVVTGLDGDRILAALSGLEFEPVCNPDPDSEMLASVRCGLRALPSECDASLVALGDQPGISRGLVESMIGVQVRLGAPLVVAAFEGKRGHPLLIDRALHAEVMNAYDAVGLRGLLQAHAERVVDCQVSDPAILEDLDVPDDYSRFLRRRSSVN